MTSIVDAVAYVLYWLLVFGVLLIALHFVTGVVTRSVLRIIREERQKNEQETKRKTRVNGTPEG